MCHFGKIFLTSLTHCRFIFPLVMAERCLTHPESTKFVVCNVITHWIRPFLCSRNISDKELTEITVKYIPIYFEWDSHRCSIGLTISNRSNIITSDTDGAFKSVFSKHPIIGGRGKTVEWTVTMRRKGGRGWITMGVIDMECIENVDVESANHDIALKLCHNGYPQRFVSGRGSHLTPNKMKWNIGDRATLKIKNGRCRAYLNGKRLGNITKQKVPERFYLVLSLLNKDTVLETTFFEIV